MKIYKAEDVRLFIGGVELDLKGEGVWVGPLVHLDAPGDLERLKLLAEAQLAAMAEPPKVKS